MSATEQSIEQRLQAHLGAESAEQQPAEAAPAAEQPVEQEQPALSLAVADEQPVEQEQPEAAEQPAEAQPAEAAEEQPADDGLTISTLQELAEYNEIDPADLYKLSIPVKDPDGLDVSMTLGDIKDSVQDTRRAERIRTEAEEMKTALDAQRKDASEKFERQAQETGAALQQAHQLLLHEFNSIDWDGLRQANPTEWAAKRQEMQEREAQLRGIYQNVDQRYQQVQAERQQVADAEMGEKLQREGVALLNRIPEWRDESVRKAEVSELHDFLLDNGYGADEVDGAGSMWQSDHRLVALGRDAMRYRKQQKTGKVAMKKVPKGVKAPLKPGARQSKADINAQHDSKLRDAQRKASGRESMQIAAQRIAARIK